MNKSIDKELDTLIVQIDNIHKIAINMNNEMVTQTTKVKQMDTNICHANDKINKVNIVQKYLLNIFK